MLQVVLFGHAFCDVFEVVLYCHLTMQCCSLDLCFPGIVSSLLWNFDLFSLEFLTLLFANFKRFLSGMLLQVFVSVFGFLFPLN